MRATGIGGEKKLATLTQEQIDQRVLDLYDEYCHGGIDRRPSRSTIRASRRTM
jgi:hypothetical protein